MIPTFRRPQALAALLKAITEIEFPRRDFEVIVVDDSGCGDLEAVLAPFRQRYSLISLRTPHLGPAPARQAGIDLAKGEYLVFTDDDCIPDPNWLRELHAGLKANPECAVGGEVVNGLPENLFCAASQTIFDYVLQQHAQTQVDYLGTGNAAYPAAAFRSIGGLDRNWQLWGGEDRDLSRRWRRSGRRMVVHRAARIHHFHPLSLSRFCNQHFRYGRGASRFHQTSPLPRCEFYLGLIAAGFRGGGQHPRAASGMMVILSQAATVCGFIFERGRRPGFFSRMVHREPAH